MQTFWRLRTASAFEDDKKKHKNIAC